MRRSEYDMLVLFEENRTSYFISFLITEINYSSMYVHMVFSPRDGCISNCMHFVHLAHSGSLPTHGEVVRPSMWRIRLRSIRSIYYVVRSAR